MVDNHCQQIDLNFMSCDERAPDDQMLYLVYFVETGSHY